jgi:hypothetical protein
MRAKAVDKLTAEDIAGFPVWEYDTSGETERDRDETWVVPVTELPVSSLSSRVVGVTLRLGGQAEVGLLGNIDLGNPQATREFATLSVYRAGVWFHLARYFDADRDVRGPVQLAEFLGLSIAEVFPVHYDLSGVAIGHPETVRGSIEAEPQVRLTAPQRMVLIFGH